MVRLTVRNASADCTRITPGNRVMILVFIRSKSGIAIGRTGEQIASDDFRIALRGGLELVERGACWSFNVTEMKATPGYGASDALSQRGETAP